MTIHYPIVLEKEDSGAVAHGLFCDPVDTPPSQA